MNSFISTPESRAFTGGRERKQRSASLCNLTLIFSSARRQNTSLSGPSGWVCMRRQQQCVPVCVCECMALVGETVPAITGQTESVSTVHCNHKHSYASHHLQTSLWMVLAKSVLHFCTGPRIIVYIIASNLWRELDGRGPVLKTTSVSHRNPETYWKEQEKNNFYSNKMLLLRCASLLL